MQIRKNTIIMTVGPSTCGKSYFAKQTGFQVISSDEIRRELVGDLDRYDPRMLEVSKQAFDILIAKLDASTSYPVNNTVVVDTTGLSDSFRKQVLEIAKKNHYEVVAVIFDFKERYEYFGRGDKSVISDQVVKLKQELRNIRAKDFTRVFVTKFGDFPTFELEDRFFYDGRPNIVSDIHGDLNRLNTVLENFPDNLIFVGDLIDKGPNSKEVLIKVLELMKSGRAHVVRGNHENYVLKYLLREIEEKYEYFTSIDQYKDDEEFFDLLQEVWNRSHDFIEGNGFIVTHSPCDIKYLGKTDPESVKNQRNFRYTHLTEEQIVEELGKFAACRNTCFPKHIFGHIEFSNPYRNNGMIGIDTDGVRVYNGRVHTFGSGGIDVLNEVNLDDVDPKILRKCEIMLEKGVKFLSGTVCPADKLGNDLESIEWAMNYYGECVIQPKFMGSRATVYLNKDVSKSFYVTRNGFKREEFIEDYNRLHKLFDFSDYETVILDAELLPWSYLGEDLIDRSFREYSKLVNNEYELLKNSGFFDLKFDKHPEFFTMSKKDFIEKYGHHTYKFNSSTVRPVTNAEVFDRQLDLYGKIGTPYFEPFSILAYDDRLCEDSTYDMFKRINSNPVIKTSSLKEATEFFNSLTIDKGFEGVVVKPEFPLKTERAPYIKVRNPEYLTLVYGHDYKEPHNYSAFLRNKRIGGKLKASIREYKLGMKMLTSNSVRLMATFLSDGNPYDPRL